MRVKDAMREMRSLGLVLKRDETGEWRVNFKGGRDGTAYYASDLDDAVATGRSMARSATRRETEPSTCPGCGTHQHPIEKGKMPNTHFCAKCGQRGGFVDFYGDW